MLEIIGALALTGLLVYITLGNLAVYMWSDENVWNTTKWNWRQLWLGWFANVVLAIGWWFIVGTRLTIGLN